MTNIHLYTLFCSGGHSELIILNIHKLEVLKFFFYTNLFGDKGDHTRGQMTTCRQSVFSSGNTGCHDWTVPLPMRLLIHLRLPRFFLFWDGLTVQPWFPCNYAEDWAGLKLVAILLPLPPKWWDNRDALPCLAQTLLFLHIHNTIIYLDVCVYACIYAFAWDMYVPVCIRRSEDNLHF